MMQNNISLTKVKLHAVAKAIYLVHFLMCS